MKIELSVVMIYVKLVKINIRNIYDFLYDEL